MGEGTEEEFYEISAVARLTGLSTHVLRVWERRYGVVEPDRTDTKRRRYGRQDIHRLTLLKSLVDHGHTISSIAKLEIEALEERISEVLSSEQEGQNESVQCRIGLVAVQSRAAVRDAADSVESMMVTAEFATLEEMIQNIKPKVLDVLVVEAGSLFQEDIEAIQKAVKSLGANRAVVIYQFAKDEVFEPGNIEKITALRAPVTPAEIILVCSAGFPIERGEKVPLQEKGPNDEIPERLYSSEQLVTLSKHASVVDCECPQHLSSLLNGLNAFEDYSKECENRSQEDAELHAYLYQATANCRFEMEKALKHLLEVEGIRI